MENNKENKIWDYLIFYIDQVEKYTESNKRSRKNADNDVNL